MKTVQNITLVIGGTGKTGRRVVQRLQASGHPLRFGSRAGNPPFESKDPETWCPAGNVREPFIDAEDIAEVAVAALTGEGHAGQLYELTGLRLLTFAEAIEEIAAATGQKIGYLQVSPEQYVSTLAEQDVSDEFAWLLQYLFTRVLDGRNAYLSDGVQRALGRSPRDISDYAREAAASGVWGGASR